jgi:hypothetical protein
MARALIGEQFEPTRPVRLPTSMPMRAMRRPVLLSTDLASETWLQHETWPPLHWSTLPPLPPGAGAAEAARKTEEAARTAKTRAIIVILVERWRERLERVLLGVVKGVTEDCGRLTAEFWGLKR